MKYVQQTKTHSENQRGNCFATCLAMLLDMELADIPEFEEMKGVGQWGQELIIWTQSKGIKFSRQQNPPAGYAIAKGMSARGIRHAVIVKDGEFLHDPHPSGEFLDSIEAYWVFKNGKS